MWSENTPKPIITNPSDKKLREMIAEKDQEIAGLKKDAERYRKLRRMVTISTPERFDAFIDSADESAVKTEMEVQS